MDVGIIFRIYSFEFRVQSFVARAGQAGISLGDLGKGISVMEVGVVVIPWEPGCCVVGDLVGLWGEGFVLYESTEGFGVSEVFCP